MVAEIEYKVIPREVSCFKLNSDGTYQSCDALKCSVYIEDTKAAAIWDPCISKFIRENYGPIVGIMHSVKSDIEFPVYDTAKFILGS